MLRSERLHTRPARVTYMALVLASSAVTAASVLAYHRWAQLEVTPTVVIRRSAYPLHPLEWGFGPGSFGCGICSDSSERWGLIGIRTTRCPRGSGVTP
jgi:hypothetical protein